MKKRKMLVVEMPELMQKHFEEMCRLSESDRSKRTRGLITRELVKGSICPECGETNIIYNLECIFECNECKSHWDYYNNKKGNK